MDIRKFFGVINVGKKHECGSARKNVKSKNESEKAKPKEIKVKTSSPEDFSEQRQVTKKKRIIYDSDSEDELQLVKKSKKSPNKKQSLKPSKILKKDPVVYVSETDEDEDFVHKKVSKKPKENEMSASLPLVTSAAPKADAKLKIQMKPLSPEKLTPTSVVDYFGMGSIQRSENKLVSSKRKEPSQSRDSTLEDEAIAKQLQLEENAELERQLHEDEEFARTLAVLDETLKKKKPRKDPEDKQGISTTKTNPAEMERNKQVHKVKPPSLTLDSRNYAAKDQTCTESTRIPPDPYPESSVRKDRKALGNNMQCSKMSSKLAALKQKGESIQRENGTPKVKSAPLEEEKTPEKEKISPQKSKSVSPEDSEKKRANYQAYRIFLNREGPKALGTKEIPQGGENCLEGLTFVITGVLESIERDEAKSLIERYGGKVTGNVSKKTNYLIRGRDCGVSKCEKASALGTKIVDEDGLFDLIRTMPDKKSKYEAAAEAEETNKSFDMQLLGILRREDTEATFIKRRRLRVSPASFNKAKKVKSKREKTPQKVAETREISPAREEIPAKKKKPTPRKDSVVKSTEKETTEARRGLFFDQKASVNNHAAADAESPVQETSKGKAEVLLWVDKYKPTSLRTIIGQQGDQSCAKKLLRWLQNWHKNTSEDRRVKSSMFGGKDDGANFKAALLSGPPGVGKTTTASLVCEELGLSYVELNASDTRSKNSLKEMITDSLNNTSIKGFCSGASTSVSSKHVLIMDEVDGMAGSEDRGGIQELIDLIKHTKVPIICMCNDRNHPKIRSLVHYCFDLRFQRPRVEQVKGAMMSIAFKEGLKVPPPAMNEIILAANLDIRQVLHNLSMWGAKNEALTYDSVKEDASKAKKDIKLGPFDVVRKVFAIGEEASRMSLIDKSDLFFHNYSLAPLFVQENYIHVKPAAAGGNMKKHLILLSKAADSICDGDLVDRQIRSKQNWSLLPIQAIYSSVLPGELMRGYMNQFPNFPSWLGKFSSTGKHDRILQELSMHMSLRTHASKRAVNLDYLPYLKDAIVRPLCCLGTDGVRDAVAFMDSYCLMKEDTENLMEITSWGGEPGAFSKVNSKVKAAFTRTYNKETHLTPYSLQVVKKSKRRAESSLDTELNEELEADGEFENEQQAFENDAMIKKKTRPAKQSKVERNEETKKGKAKKKSK